MNAFAKAVAFAAVMSGALLSGAAATPAKAASAFRTSPAELDSLQAAALDAFGDRLIRELYETKSRVGSPTGQIGGRPNQDDRNAVRNVKALYDERALIQSARHNYGVTKKTMRPSDVDGFSVSDMRLRRADGDVLVASYTIQLPDRVSLASSTMMSGEKQPQIVVLRWNDRRKQWLVFSEADFDRPKSALCGTPPGAPIRKSRFAKTDVALARRNIERFQDASFAGAEKSVQAKGFSYVVASGDRKTEDGPVRARLRAKATPINVEAIRSGDLLAARFDASSKLDMDGAPLEDSLKPRLMTMIRGADGEWRLLAIAIFSTTARLAADAKCVQPTAQ